jgi:hypothetical protein
MSILHDPGLPAEAPGLEKKGHTRSQDMASHEIPEDVQFAIPYAGITQIRFKGYLLSQYRRPLLFGSFLLRMPLEIKPDSVIPVTNTQSGLTAYNWLIRCFASEQVPFRVYCPKSDGESRDHILRHSMKPDPAAIPRRFELALTAQYVEQASFTGRIHGG